MLWRLFFWCLLKLLCSQRCWKVTRLSHLLPPSSQGKRICIYGKWNSGGKNQCCACKQGTTRCAQHKGLVSKRSSSQVGVKKNLFLLIYLFVCWFGVSWVAAKCLWAKQIHVPFLSFFFSFFSYLVNMFSFKWVLIWDMCVCVYMCLLFKHSMKLVRVLGGFF